MNNINNLNSYEKISDDLCHLGYGFKLKFNVILGNKSQNNTKIPFHNEYKYSSNKYINQNNLITIKRKFDYYLSIESSYNDVNTFIMIRQQDMIHLKMNLHKVYTWFTLPEYNDMYAFDKGKLVLARKVNPVYIKGLCSDNFIIIEPTILTYNSIDIEGITFILSDITSFNMTIDKFMELYYIIDNFNMYLSAQLLINYMSSPFIGENQNVMSEDFNDNNIDFVDPGFKGANREPYIANGNKKLSFFDKMKKM